MAVCTIQIDWGLDRLIMVWKGKPLNHITGKKNDAILQLRIERDEHREEDVCSLTCALPNGSLRVLGGKTPARSSQLPRLPEGKVKAKEKKRKR